MILKSGVVVDGIKCIPTRVKVRSTDKTNDKCIVEISIVEGRNHIIKNVFFNLGYLVDKLTRIKYADLTLDKLQSGEYRSLTIKEVKRLYESAK
jgi:23S rRNA pseudouridine2605 synthase